MARNKEMLTLLDSALSIASHTTGTIQEMTITGQKSKTPIVARIEGENAKLKLRPWKQLGFENPLLQDIIKGAKTFCAGLKAEAVIVTCFPYKTCTAMNVIIEHKRLICIILTPRKTGDRGFDLCASIERANLPPKSTMKTNAEPFIKTKKMWFVGQNAGIPMEQVISFINASMSK